MNESITNSEGKPVIYAPLCVIVLLTAIKDLIQDYKRYINDLFDLKFNFNKKDINQIRKKIIK